ncbi:MAG TPA: hypothetical protein PKH65_05610 [Bacteroidia bacterium]|nr:hypothetical protein [Bacteroidia bacterium]HNT80139.1 hypothetical protein [Bacteroidia bacterium]
MKLPGFFKIPKHKEFAYKPRYYNERKEELDRQIKNIESQSHSFSDRIHKAYNRRWSSEKTSTSRQSNLRLVLIIAALAVLSYLILFY